MKGILKLEKDRDEVSSDRRMEKFTRGFGSKTKDMGRVDAVFLINHYTRETGSEENEMEMDE